MENDKKVSWNAYAIMNTNAVSYAEKYKLKKKLPN